MPASDTQLDAIPADELELRRRRLQLQAEAARLAAEAAELDEQIARAKRLAGSSASTAAPHPIPSSPAPPAKLKSKSRFLLNEDSPAPSLAVPVAPIPVPSIPLAPIPITAVPATHIPAGPPAEVTPNPTLPAPSPPVPSASAAATTSIESNPSEAATATVPRRFFITIPSWAVSMIVHMVLIIALGICTITPKLQELYTFEGSIAVPYEELIEEQITQVQFEAPNENSIAAVLAHADVGMADLGNSAEVSTALASIDNGDLNVDVGTGDFGELFGSTGSGMAAVGQGTGGAEFFGVKATGKKFVFVVDSSRSMQNGKFDDACQELYYAIQRLKSDQYFYVIFFDQDAARMTFAPNVEPEPGYARAITPNLKKLDAWMKTVELEGQTNPYDALVFARSLSPDAIYILTDGQFTDRGRSVDYLKLNNLYKDPVDGLLPKSVIHTVGFYDPDGEETLQAIAKDHGGTYRFVPRPKAKMRQAN